MDSVTIVNAEFSIADDLLWEAAAGRLVDRGPIRVRPSGRIGPLVEVAMARADRQAAYAQVTCDPLFSGLMEQALNASKISGGGAAARMGVFPLRRCLDGDLVLWDQWALHAENAAVVHGLSRPLVSRLIGALGELQDNVFEHSELPSSGLVAYATGPSTFEFVVADAGIGVLASLKKNPEFASLSHTGEALQVAASDGASRYERSSGHGYGIGCLFRALAHDAGELRFRSGDYALTISGDRPSLTGNVEIAKKAWLDGLIVSVRCAASDKGGGG